MASKYIDLFPIPKTFPEILHDFAKEVIRVRPEDIYDFGIAYFKALENKTVFNYPEKNETEIERKEREDKEKEMVLVDNQRQLDKYDQGRFNKSMEKSEKIKEFEEKHFSEQAKEKENKPSHETSRNVSGFVDDVIVKTVSRLGTEINDKMNEDKQQQEEQQGDEEQGEEEQEQQGDDVNEEGQEGEQEGEEQYQEGEEEEGLGEGEEEGKGVGEEEAQGEGQDEEEGEEENAQLKSKMMTDEDKEQAKSSSLENAQNFVDDVIQQSLDNLKVTQSINQREKEEDQDDKDKEQQKNPEVEPEKEK